jgi:hypothetical protein
MTSCFRSKIALTVSLVFVASFVHADEKPDADSEGWIELFNGKDLSGWKASENKGTFKVQDGKLVVKGDRSHLFYVGPVEKANFKNFEWKCEILTKPKANSGMYFHTEYQEEGWPSKGYEVQVNNTHPDPRKTGSLYAVKDVMNKAPAKDDQWFTQTVIVNGKKVTIKVNDKVVTEYTEPEDTKRPGVDATRIIDSGTFAIQGHDPESEIHYRRIMVKPLP